MNAAKARDWERVSYSIDKKVLEGFTAGCKRQGVKASRAVEEFMREFNKL